MCACPTCVSVPATRTAMAYPGGAPAAFDPMSEHLTAFEWALAQYLGAGVAACYRGFRIFNDPASEVCHMHARVPSKLIRAGAPVLTTRCLPRNAAGRRQEMGTVGLYWACIEVACAIVCSRSSRRAGRRVREQVGFYKAYRDILISDIIHVVSSHSSCCSWCASEWWLPPSTLTNKRAMRGAQRRPDGQSIDCFMHANPFLHNRGLAMVFNPASTAQSIGLQLPLYYTGVALWRLATLGRLVCCPPPLLAEVVVCRDHNGGDGFG